MNSAIISPERDVRRRWISARAGAIFLTLVFPVLCVLLGTRLAMTEAFLNFEYHRPGFPADFYGFTTEDRMRYAPYAVNYLINGEAIGYLADLRFDSGESLFNARELHHMRDVQQVTQIAFVVGFALTIGAIAVAAFLWRTDRSFLWSGLRHGALFSLSIIAAIVVLAVVSWDFFFTAFHRIFFEDGTWMFLYSDTLIRLFPEQFWFDAAIAIAGLTIMISVVVLLATGGVRFKRR